MGIVGLDYFEKFFSYGDTGIDEFRSIFPSCCGPERVPDSIEALHSFWIMGDKFRKGRIKIRYHFPECGRKIIRSPSKLVRIVKAIGNKFSLGGF